ncbi:MAG: thioredoxin family protein [Alphaproteobacteria bacterium]|nr:thioredoxin family protein [Alphaproteobacteria bacterium]
MPLLSLLLTLACATNSPPAAPEAAVTEAPAPEAPKAAPAASVATVGQPAPDFTLTDTEGVEHSLSAHQGKTVVLEWFNPDCPFVVYAHGEGGPLVELPQTWIDQGVVWLAINSGAPGKQGAGQERNVAAKGEYGMGYPVLLDASGQVGQSYGAKTTPHVFVVNPEGTLVYKGALDNAPLGKLKGDAPENYVSSALSAVLAGGAVATAETTSYGCSVKYGS